jgi:hypothetical protein
MSRLDEIRHLVQEGCHCRKCVAIRELLVVMDAILMGNTLDYTIRHLESYRDVNAWWSAEHNYKEVIGALRGLL